MDYCYGMTEAVGAFLRDDYITVLIRLPLYCPRVSISFHLLSAATSVTTGIKLCEDYACYTLVYVLCTVVGFHVPTQLQSMIIVI